MNMHGPSPYRGSGALVLGSGLHPVPYASLTWNIPESEARRRGAESDGESGPRQGGRLVKSDEDQAPVPNVQRTTLTYCGYATHV